MPYANFDRIALYYEEHGGGTPVLLVPGLGGVGSYWGPQIEAFASQYRVIVHDHRGTGRSTHDPIEYSLRQMATDVVRLMDALKIEKAHLVGHSTGGAIGQILAIDHPDRLLSMVLYATWTKADPFMRRIFDMRKTLVLNAGTKAYIDATPLFLYPDWWINENHIRLQAACNSSLEEFPSAQITASRAESLLQFDRVDQLETIATPTLVLCAQDDYLTPPYFSRELANHIPNSKLAMLERGGHACSQTVPEEFNEVVLHFLRAQAGVVAQ